MPSIGLQLYTLRDLLPGDYAGVIRKVAEMGYAGVETAGFPGTTPEAAAKLFKELGLEVPSAHSDLPLGDKKQAVLDTFGVLGCKRLVCPFFPPDQFTTRAGIAGICDKLNEAQAVAKANGLTLYYHNHWWEYREVVEGRPVNQWMLELLDPGVHLEIDTYWVKTGGVDPASVLRDLGNRASLLHIKDGPADETKAMLAVGSGVMDWAAVQSAAQADWWIVELDRCDTDMVTAVSQSYQFLASKGYARGTK